MKTDNEINRLLADCLHKNLIREPGTPICKCQDCGTTFLSYIAEVVEGA